MSAKIINFQEILLLRVIMSSISYITYYILVMSFKARTYKYLPSILSHILSFFRPGACTFEIFVHIIYNLRDLSFLEVGYQGTNFFWNWITIMQQYLPKPLFLLLVAGLFEPSSRVKTSFTRTCEVLGRPENTVLLPQCSRKHSFTLKRIILPLETSSYSIDPRAV